MNAIDEMKKVIEETREELDTLILTGKYENYYVVSQKMDALIEAYLDKQELTVA